MSGHYDEDHGYVPGTPRLRPLLAAKEAAIRADERAKCRAELRDAVAEVERIARDDYGSALDVLYDFTKEAFGGE